MSQSRLHDAFGDAQDVSVWRGQAVLINFWAGWCGPCRREMPALQAVAKGYAPQGVRVVGVAVDDPAAAQRLAHVLGVGYPLLYGRSAADELLQACSEPDMAEYAKRIVHFVDGRVDSDRLNGGRV